jgi:hypothetical protein
MGLSEAVEAGKAFMNHLFVASAHIDKSEIGPIGPNAIDSDAR